MAWRLRTAGVLPRAVAPGIVALGSPVAAQSTRWLQLDYDLFNALDQNGATTIAVASGRAFAISVIVPPRFARSGVTYGSNRQAAHDRTGGGDRQIADCMFTGTLRQSTMGATPPSRSTRCVTCVSPSASC